MVKKKKIPKPQKLTKKQKLKEIKHKARRKSIKEGIYASARGSFGERYIAPFAIALNTSNPLVALLGAISGLFGPFSQIIGSKQMFKKSRKKIISRNMLKETFIWLFFIIIAVLFYKNIIIGILPIALLLVFAFYILFNHLLWPAYISWVGDIVDEKYRGRWLSKRTLIIEFASIIFAISAAFLLDYFKKQELLMVGFIILFALALVARFRCYRIYTKQYFPKIKIRKKDYFTFWQFLKKSRKTNFGKFARYRTLLAIAHGITGPLIAIYLLRNLEFNYVSYMAIILSAVVYSVLVLNLWGRMIDLYGSYKVLLITSLILPLIPFAWVLSPSKLYLVLVPSLLGGIAWAGFTLAERNFIYDNLSIQKRGLGFSYYNMIVGIGLAIGAGISALLLKFLNITWIEPVILIFLIGGVLRIIVVLFGIKKTKEIKKKKKLKNFKQFERFIIRQAKPILIEEVHEIYEIKDYLSEK